MDERDRDNLDPSTEHDPPGEDDFEALAAFYERTGAMAVNTIGPPIDRPIIPSRRPDRLGDFAFSPKGAEAQEPPSAPSATDDPEAAKIRQEFLEMLHEQLKCP